MSCMNQCGGFKRNSSNSKKKQVAGHGAHGHTVMDSSFYGRPEYGLYSTEEMAKMGASVGGCDDKKQKGGEGAHGHTVMDSSFYGRPEYGLYSTEQMAKMGASVGGGVDKRQKGGQGAHGHTVMDSSFYGRPEYGLYSADEMAKMGATVGGATVYKVEGSEKNKQRGGALQNNSEHQRRMRGIIANMIDISDSHDKDIIDVLQHEMKEDKVSKYSKKEAEQFLKEYYLFNPDKTTQTINGVRKFQSNLLQQFLDKHQTGGNRVTLPLSFFTGEIADKIVVPAHVDNYCAN